MQDSRVVGMYSKKLNNSETNYTTVKKELYAIIKFLEKFRSITWGKEIKIYTDSENITTINE